MNKSINNFDHSESQTPLEMFNRLAKENKVSETYIQEVERKEVENLKIAYEQMPIYEIWEKQKIKFYFSKILITLGSYLLFIISISIIANITNIDASMPSYLNILFLLLIILFLFLQVRELEGLIYKLDRHYKLRLKLKELEVSSRKYNKDWTHLRWNDKDTDLGSEDMRLINKVIKTKSPKII